MKQSSDTTVVQPQVIVIMAGGTGGHVFPALATAQALQAKGYCIHWIGTQASFEANTVPQYNIPLHYISIKGVRGKGVLGLFLAPFRIMFAVGQCLALLRKLQPSIVIGMGGFVSGPGGAAAKLLGVPVLVQEQNAVAGTTNRLLSKVAKHIFTAFDHVLETPEKTSVVGNPLRESILQLPHYTQRPLTSGALKLLVIGGSLGAQALNETVPRIMKCLEPDIRPEIMHQCGGQHLEATIAAYAANDVVANVQAFIKQMEAAYQWADIIICRAGALTVSEIIAVGVPAIFVPLPHAIDDHQTANAQKLVAAGGALMFKQSEFIPESVAQTWKLSLNDRDKLKQMSENLSSLSTGNATQAIVEYCHTLLTDK